MPTRVLITIHTNVSLNARQSTMARGRLIPHFVKRFYPWADDVVAVSEGVADDLATITGLDRSCIRVIYNPVDIERIVALAKEPLEHPWFTPGAAPPVILGIGRLTQQKDFPTLFQAFDRARRRHPARLLILGEGRDRAALEALARELGCEADLSLPGFVDNPYPFIAAARVFVLSSAWEGFGNALIEAMALGTPVISTDCPSGPAEILGHGRYGRLLPVGDVAGLAQAIEEALAMRRDGNAGIDRAAQFSIPIVTAQYLDAIERVRQ